MISRPISRASPIACQAQAARSALPKAPEVVDGADGEGTCAALSGDDDELADPAEEDLLVGSLVRILTCAASTPQAATAMCEAGALPVLVRLLQRPTSLLQVTPAACYVLPPASCLL